MYFYQRKWAPTIQKLLKDEGIVVSRISIWKFLCLYANTLCISRKEGSGRPSKLTPEVMSIVEQQMTVNDETTASQLHKLLVEKGVTISITTILRCRDQLGWTFRGSAYCQMIRAANKVKRLEWARNNLDEVEDGFEDVI